MAKEPRLRILLVDDEEIIHQTIGDYLREAGQQVTSVRDGRAALEAVEAGHHDLALVDLQMPGMDGLALTEELGKTRPEMPVVIVTGHPELDMAIRALRLGAADFLTKPVKLSELDAVLEKSLRLGGLRRDKRRLRGAIRGIQAPARAAAAETLVGPSPATQELRRQIRQAVEARCETILITGETGTGKEVTARQIHFQTASPEDPFIAVSCPAMPDSLVESELFGHVKGAFTGATEDRMGYFEMANGSTILLDEAGDLSPLAQVKILRVLETRTLRRVGGSEEIALAVRVIAATNAPLEEYVAAGKFRRDLFYRLNAFTIRLVPLRERREDILPLAEHFLAAYAAARNLTLAGFSPAAQEKLLAYDFPGNVRELRCLVERAAILCRSGQVGAELLALGDERPSPPPPPSADHQQHAHILSTLQEVRWNRRAAAKLLGVPYSTLRYKMQKLGIGR
jgi:DNA-binding NtrC family response regulator